MDQKQTDQLFAMVNEKEKKAFDAGYEKGYAAGCADEALVQGAAQMAGIPTKGQSVIKPPNEKLEISDQEKAAIKFLTDLGYTVRNEDGFRL